MRKKETIVILAIICSVLALAFSSCRQKGAEESSNVSETSSISALLFDREEIVGVHIPLERFYSYSVYVVTNEDERTEVLTTLYDADLTSFSDAELPGVGGATVSFTICAKDKEQDLRIISDGSIQYIVISDSNGNRICKKGESGSFDFQKLNQLITDILSNETDPDYSGTVTISDLEITGSVNKGNCARVKSLMDKAILDSNLPDIDSDALYDIEFKMGDTAYCISSDSGQFFRSNGNETQYGLLNEQKLMEVKVWLGVYSATLS